MSDRNPDFSQWSPDRLALLMAQLSENIPLDTITAQERRSGALPLSFAQERLWFLNQLEPGGSHYNVPVGLHAHGKLNIPLLEQCLAKIIERHEVLRTTFDIDKDHPVQVATAKLAFVLPVVDLGDVPEETRGSEALRLAEVEAQRPFDLSRGPLLRGVVWRLNEDNHVVLVTMHHIVTDGWSINIFMRELAALYEGGALGEQTSLAALPIQYADFALWQRRSFQGEELNRQLAYWRKQLAGAPSVLQLPTDYLRPSAYTFHGAYQSLSLSKSLCESLKVVGQQEGATLFMTLLAAFNVLLFHYTGQDDIVVGSPISGRTRSETEGLIGFFVNTLVLRTSLAGDPTFQELLGRARAVMLGAYDHQDLPFEQLVAEVNPKRDLAQPPLFQVMFALDHDPLPEKNLHDVVLSPIIVRKDTVNCDLTVSMVETPRELSASFAYSTELFDNDTISRLMRSFKCLLEGIADNPEQNISRLPLLLETGFAESNGVVVDYPEDRCLHELFEAQVHQNPNARAVTFDGEHLTYRELNQRANQIAHLLQKLGVGPEVPVGICVERSLDMVVGILSILKAGGAYVPIDPAHPKERQHFVLEDAKVSAILTTAQFTPELSEGVPHIICLDEDWDHIAAESVESPLSNTRAGNLAYIIYTSGSTGQPKGCLVEHRNVTRLLAATDNYFSFSSDDTWTLFHSYGFDFSVWEIWGALLHGGRLVIVPHWVSRSPETFLKMLQLEHVTVLNQTPSAFYQLLGAMESKVATRGLSLRVVIFGGEALQISSLKPWFEHYGNDMPKLINMYGITETTVHATYRPMNAADVDTSPGSMLGHALPDVTVYILGEHMRSIPIGVLGELTIGGAGVTRGYLNKPELTAERFVPDPFSNEPGGRLYKSGDMGRFLASGDIEFLGRIDLQVKIRGHRIELQEIESVLLKHQAVESVAVVSKQYDLHDTRLVAYIVPHAQRARTLRQLLQLTETSLLAGLKQTVLPNGMTVMYVSNTEANDFMYKDMFEDQIFLRNGIVLKEGDTVFDVGANIGMFSLAVGEICKRGAIYAFEPIPETYNALRANAALYDLNIKAFNCGLGKTPGTEIFTYYPEFSYLSSKFSDLDKDREMVQTIIMQGITKSATPEAFPEGEALDQLLRAKFTQQSFPCEIRTVSQVMSENKIKVLDLLKIDVEKSELDVLYGITDEDWDRIRQVIVETNEVDGHLDEIFALLQRHGYDIRMEQLFDYGNSGYFQVIGVKPANSVMKLSQSLGVQINERSWCNRDDFITDLQRVAKEALPDYMVPSAWELMESLPITPSGKTDRGNLPEPEGKRRVVGKPFVAARSPIEEQLTNIWTELLGTNRIGIHEDFFELGGHSLLATRVVSRVREAFDVELPLRVIFDQAFTIAELSRLVLEQQSKNLSPDQLASIMEELEALSDEEARSLLDQKWEESQ